MSIEIGTTLRQDANTPTPLVLRDYRTGADLQDAEGNKATLLVLGDDSDAAKRCERAFQRRVKEHAQRTRSSSITAEMWEEHQVAKAVATTVGWEHVAYQGEAAFSLALAERFFKNEPWALEQQEEFRSNRANFSGASKTP